MKTGVHYNSVTKYRVTVCTPRNHENKPVEKNNKLKLKENENKIHLVESHGKRDKDQVHFLVPDMRLKIT